MISEAGLLDAVMQAHFIGQHGLMSVIFSRCQLRLWLMEGRKGRILCVTPPDYVIQVRGDVLREEDGPILRHGLQELDGARILLPGDDDL